MISVVILMLTRFELLKQFNKGETAQSSFLYEPVTQLAPFIIPILEDVDKDTILDQVDRKVDRVRDAVRDIIRE